LLDIIIQPVYGDYFYYPWSAWATSKDFDHLYIQFKFIQTRLWLVCCAISIWLYI